MAILFKEKIINLLDRVCPELEILHLSDLHLRGANSAIEEAIKRAAAICVYDFIFLTGDLADEEKGVAYLADYLAALRAKYGTFFVWGNHDKYHCKFHHLFTFKIKSVGRMIAQKNLESFIANLHKMGVRILSDSISWVSVEGSKIYIIGIDDFRGADRLLNWQEHQHRIDKIRKMIKDVPSGNIVFVLSHIPDIIEKLQGTRMDVLFAGHTHGGQIRLPFIGPLISWSTFQRKYSGGLYNYNGTYLHINPGLGTSRCTPFRLCCPAEISFVRIKGQG